MSEDSSGLSAAFKPGPDCLPIDDLARNMDFPPESVQRKAAEEHVSGCAHCRTELALLHEFVAGTVRADEKDAVDWIEGRLTTPQRFHHDPDGGRNCGRPDMPRRLRSLPP
jgi:hypothetical protein